MLKAIFTLDYEIHGNGEGCPRALMIEPTHRMLDLFDEYGARLTIMADIGEILKFKQYAEEHNRDDYHYGEIVAQLKSAVKRGHDVQLHIHSSYFNSTHNGNRWVQSWDEYNFAGLDLTRMTQMVKEGRDFLESTLRPVNPDYRCVAFRAANWSVSPSRNVSKALLANGIEIDTSIFKYGSRKGLVTFDYSGAHSEIVPWPASEENFCVSDDRSRLWEFPIYSENRWVGAFITANRIYRAAQGSRHSVKRSSSDKVSTEPGGKKATGLTRKLSFLTKKHAWKADFNQCTGRQLVRALHRAEHKTSSEPGDVPFVLIGHSKIFSRWNEQSLRPFLAHVASRPSRFGFATFDSFARRGRNETPREMAAAAGGVL